MVIKRVLMSINERKEIVDFFFRFTVGEISSGFDKFSEWFLL